MADMADQATPEPKLRVLELYCGIGGAASALRPGATVARAYDVSELALGVYRSAHDHPADCVSLESLPTARLAAADADLWWLSPPCQPFTRRGHGGDEADPRSRSLLSLVPKMVAVEPRYLALENVPGFADSATRGRLCAALESAGYALEERLICPTELGVPMRRRRYYLLASAPGAPRVARSASSVDRALDDCVASRFDDHPDLAVDPAIREAYRGALDIVTRDDPDARCACFTSAYGRSPVRSGSYLRMPRGRLRRFHPREILALLGFPRDFRLPEDLDCRRAWRLVGNSVSVDVVRHWLSAVPDVMRASG